MRDGFETWRTGLWDGRALAIVYVLVALPTVILLSYVNPPFQSPDEPNHVLRAVMTSRGILIGHRVAPDNAGATVYSKAPEVVHRFYRLGSTDPFDYAKLDEAGKIGWHLNERSYTPFVNTVIYPPFFYLPAAAALRVGQLAKLSVIDSYLLARVATGVVAVLTAAVAIWLAGHGRLLLFLVLSLPTTLFLFSSVSQDGLMVASAALVAGLYARAFQRGRTLSVAERYAAALLLGALMAGRPPYAPLLAILLTPTTQPLPAGDRSARAWLRFLGPFLTAMAVGIGWIVFGAAPARVPFRISDGVSVTGQLLHVLGNPVALVQVFFRTLADSGLWHLKQMVAVFGWSEIYLSPVFYTATFALLAVCAALVLILSRRDSEAGAPIDRWMPSLVIGAALLSFAAIYFVQYLTWTPVGAVSVDGVQGRYFLPIATFLPLAFLRAGPVNSPVQSLRPLVTAADVAVVAFLFTVVIYVPWTIWDYYH